MPQAHLFIDKNKATSLIFRKIYFIEDPTLVILNSHLILEAIIYKFVQSKVVSSHFLAEARLSFYQLLNIAKSFRNENQIEQEQWMWKMIEYINRLRNKLAHNITVGGLESRIEHIYDIADWHIDIHHPEADPSEREAKKLQFVLIILCHVVFNLDNPGFKI
jgi:hypothetical protein